MKIPLLLVLSTTLCGASWAQTQPLPIQPPTLSQADIYRIADQSARFELKNIKPSVMAYWLDPLHLLSENYDGVTYPDKTKGPFFGGVYLPGTPQKTPLVEAQVRPFPLPQGIHWLAGTDSRNILLVGGTEEGIKELARDINLLDQPLHKVELETRFVRLSADAAEELSPFQSPNDIIRVDSKFNSALGSLQKQGRATLPQSASAMAFNNFTTVLYSDSLTVPSIPPPTDYNLGAKFHLLNYSQKRPSQVSAWRLEITPMVNNDNSLTLTTHLNEATWTDDLPPLAQEDWAQQSRDALQTVVNMRDGETVALRGPRMTNSQQTIIVLLTPHIVKDAEK